ncbi:hypothetical protein L9F63_013095, partial [Diploptera punctata]
TCLQPIKSGRLRKRPQDSVLSDIEARAYDVRSSGGSGYAQQPSYDCERRAQIKPNSEVRHSIS